MKNAWIFGFLVLLLGCTIPPTCPTTRPDPHGSCDAPPDSPECSYPMPDGTTHSCICLQGSWSCDTCDFPFGYPSTEIYDCATQRMDGCEQDTSEWQIRCHCIQPEMKGICCGSDSLNGYYNCRPERQREGGPCCADCPSIPVGTGTQRCTCASDHRFHCTIL